VSGVVVCWHFELLPRWALAVLAARELFMLLASRVVLKHGLDIQIKMLGRWAVWPTMFSLFLAMVTETWVAEVLLYIGLVMTLVTTAEYIKDGWVDWKRRKPSTSA
jgi:cardiolipin synthase